ncbi:glycosyltransferase [Pantoea trifolii]|uniref:Glycosyltransferase n=1 Tax=Pantoea trifolii TaxID=2968030 RepID=A0ABT1VL85_9GAMM|nr:MULTISPECIES: glycosyltransferase [unclassified Pantoea]MCQ8228296.1 glycosyltransferase [Pantoea sp. MMK2]MCQ8236469.1 glycosyltransferase [Pantoea sp. MMK3]
MADRVLLNASNLHVGGGVQVATSVIGEITMMENIPSNLTIWSSSVVNQNLKSLNYDLSKLPDYQVKNNFGIKALFPANVKHLNSFNKVLTIFGPLYTYNRHFYSIVGFAQPWIIYSDNEVYNSLPFLTRLKTKLKFSLQQKFFNKSDEIIVELEHVAKGVIKKNIATKEHVKIIHNCLSSIYLDPSRWKEINYLFDPNRIKLGFVGRNYAHKNTKIFPQIKKILSSKYGIEVEFYVTFNDKEWELCSNEFRNEIKNVGVLTVDQCPSFYSNIDAIIFPSLLECFSATPLEAMISKKVLFASNKPFNHDVCGDGAIYFEATNAHDAAEKIAHYFKNVYLQNDFQTKIDESYERALTFANANKRAELYLERLL